MFSSLRVFDIHLNAHMEFTRENGEVRLSRALGSLGVDSGGYGGDGERRKRRKETTSNTPTLGQVRTLYI